MQNMPPLWKIQVLNALFKVSRLQHPPSSWSQDFIQMLIGKGKLLHIILAAAYTLRAQLTRRFQFLQTK